MPTNRPFLANLLFTFRAHSAATSPAASNTLPASQHPQKSQSAAASTAAAATSASAATAAAAAAAAVQGGQGSVNGGQAFTSSRARRCSSSSTEGFVEPPTGEKWWIGGRNSDGQERYYRLQPVRRHRSVDRLSVDRMSL